MLLVECRRLAGARGAEEAAIAQRVVELQEESARVIKAAASAHRSKIDEVLQRTCEEVALRFA